MTFKINVEKLISLVEIHGEVIWKKDHPKYQNRTAVQKAWDVILERLGLDADCQESRKKVRDRWSALRSRYVKEFQKEKLQTPKSGSGLVKFVTKFEHYESLKFLKDYATPRKSDSSLTTVLQDSSSENTDTSEEGSDHESSSDSNSESESEADEMGKDDKSRKREKNNSKEEKDKKEGKKSVKKVNEDKEIEIREVASPATAPSLPETGNVGVSSSLAPVLLPTTTLAELFLKDLDHVFFFLSLHKSMIKLPEDLNMLLRTRISAVVAEFSSKQSANTLAPIDVPSRSTKESPKSEEEYDVITIEDEDDPPPKKRKKNPKQIKIETVVKEERDVMNKQTDAQQRQVSSTTASTSITTLNQQVPGPSYQPTFYSAPPVQMYQQPPMWAMAPNGYVPFNCMPAMNNFQNLSIPSQFQVPGLQGILEQFLAQRTEASNAESARKDTPPTTSPTDANTSNISATNTLIDKTLTGDAQNSDINNSGNVINLQARQKQEPEQTSNGKDDKSENKAPMEELESSGGLDESPDAKCGWCGIPFILKDSMKHSCLSSYNYYWKEKNNGPVWIVYPVDGKDRCLWNNPADYADYANRSSDFERSDDDDDQLI